MIASIWSFALGCVAFAWGMASIFLPIKMTRHWTAVMRSTLPGPWSPLFLLCS